MKLFLLAGCIIFCCSMAQSEFNPSREETFRLALKHERGKFGQDYRKFVYYALAMHAETEAIRKQPDKLSVLMVPRGTGLYESSSIRVGTESPEDYLTRYSNELIMELDGGKVFTGSTIYKLAENWAAVVPDVGSALRASVRTMGELAETNKGYVPLDVDLSHDGLVEVILDLQKNNPFAFDLIDEQASQRLGFSFNDDVRAHKGVQDAALDKSQAQRDEEVIEELKSVESHIEGIKEAGLEGARKEDIERMHQLKLNAGNATFDNAAVVSDLLGEPEAAKAIRVAQKVFNLSMSIEKSNQDLASAGPNEAALATMVATQNYIAMTLLVVDLFASKDSGPDPVMLQLQEVLKRIESLTDQMHDRFDIVDTKLNTIMDELRAGVAHLNEGVATNRNYLRIIRNSVNGLYEKLDRQIIVERKNEIDRVKRNCLTNPRSYTRRRAADQFRNVCVGPITNLSSSEITRQGLGMSETPIESISIGHLAAPYAHYFPEILMNSLYPGHSMYRENLEHLPDPELWMDGSQVFLDLVNVYPSQWDVYAEDDFDDIIYVGENYVRAKESLLAKEDGRIEMNVVSKVLNDYRETIKSAFFSPEEGRALFDLTKKESNGFVLSKGANQPISTNWGQTTKHLNLCANNKSIIIKNFITPSDVARNQKYPYGFEGDGFIANWRPGGPQLVLPHDIVDQLPNQIKWLVKENPGHVDICIGQVSFNEVRVERVPIRNAVGFTLQTTYRGFVRINVMYGQEVIGVATLRKGATIPDILQNDVNSANLITRHFMLEGTDNYVSRNPGVPGIFEQFERRLAAEFPTKQERVEEILGLMIDGWEKSLFDDIESFAEYPKAVEQVHAAKRHLFALLQVAMGQEVPGRGRLEKLVLSDLLGTKELFGQLVTENLTPQEIEDTIEKSIKKVEDAFQEIHDSGEDIRPDMTDFKVRLDDLRKARKKVFSPPKTYDPQE